MHSRCDDQAIHVYLGQMVKQATKHGSTSSASSEESVARSASPPEPEMKMEMEMQSQPEQGVLDIGSPGRVPGGMPCSVEKPLIDPMMYQPAGNIFDYQISIS
ncbi:hypothetical protein BJY01DRAFT_222001 [Aspergillus pseudoustus]|uniref:Uncharacterized protein n=1 Tax=Aspergillus pseudoustus TaxID=1810923 RepID=A0ABR4J8U1_9EURO